MENIQSSLFNAHNSMVKLSLIVISDNEDNTYEAATNDNNLNNLNSGMKTY